MNFEIKNIESFFPENLILEAERLIHQGLIQGLISLEKNLWTLKVAETDTQLQENEWFEVEIQLTRKKVKAFTCECDFYQKDKSLKNHSCKHIVGGLFFLRKRLLQKELEKQKSAQSSPTKHKKLTTVAILNSVNPESLKNFVRAYARTDKKFAIALKARFAHTVQVEDNREKYFQLLQSTFNAVKNAKDKITYQGFQQVQIVIKDILEQIDDFIALENYSEANSILQAIVLKLSPNIKRAENYQDRMVALLVLAFEKLDTLVKKPLAPELKKEIWKFCLDEFDSREHKKYQTQIHFFKLLLELTTEKKHADMLITKIDEQLEYTYEKKKKGELLLVKMKLITRFNKNELSAFIKENLEESEVLLAAIKNGILQENFKEAKDLALLGLASQKSVLVKNELDDLLLNIALKTEHLQDIVTYSRKRFLITYESHYYQILKNSFTQNWATEVESILEIIKKQPYTPNKKETLALIYSKEKMNLELLNYIKKIRSLELLEKYDLQLVDDFKKEINELYEDFLESYLRNHLGRQTSQKIRDLFFHLRKIGAEKLVRKLARQYREQYPERHTLMEELAIF